MYNLDWYLNEIYDKFENDKNTEETEETSWASQFLQSTAWIVILNL